MSSGVSVDTFFRPPEIARESLHIPAPLFNRCQLLLHRCSTEHLFIPVRSMQYQAVYDDDEFIFVDSLAYAVRDGKGGRMITLAWKVAGHHDRDSLNEPVAIELVHYVDDSRELHRRLMGELPKSVQQLEERARQNGCEPKLMKVLPFRH